MDDIYYYYLCMRYMFGALIPWLIFLVAVVVAMWKIFKKADRPGWAAIIPFYNTYTLYDIVWGNGIKFLLLLIPIYNIVLTIQTNLRLAKAFGKSTGFGVGLTFLAPIFFLILGFGKAEFVGLDGVAEQNWAVDMNGYSEPKTVERVIPVAKPAEQAEQTAMPQKKPMFCAQCGAKLEGGNFCPKCGNPVKKG